MSTLLVIGLAALAAGSEVAPPDQCAVLPDCYDSIETRLFRESDLTSNAGGNRDVTAQLRWDYGNAQRTHAYQLVTLTVDVGSLAHKTANALNNVFPNDRCGDAMRFAFNGWTRLDEAQLRGSITFHGERATCPRILFRRHRQELATIDGEIRLTLSAGIEDVTEGVGVPVVRASHVDAIVHKTGGVLHALGAIDTIRDRAKHAAAEAAERQTREWRQVGAFPGCDDAQWRRDHDSVVPLCIVANGKKSPARFEAVRFDEHPLGQLIATEYSTQHKTLMCKRSVGQRAKAKQQQVWIDDIPEITIAVCNRESLALLTEWRYGSDLYWRAVATYNGLDPDKPTLQTGQQIKLPAARQILNVNDGTTAISGDSLWRLWRSQLSACSRATGWPSWEQYQQAANISGTLFPGDVVDKCKPH